MVDRDADARNLIRTKLAQSREELRSILDPPPGEPSGGDHTRGNGQGHAGFPRSRTMQILMSGRGLGTLGALAGGLMIARPALALRLLKFVPANAMAKILIAKAVGAFKSKPRNGD
jgi:hypothetical protein